MRLTRWQRIGLYILMTMGAIPLLVPLVWLVCTSLKPSLGIDEPPLYVLPRSKFETIKIDGKPVPVRTLDKLGDETPPPGKAWIKPVFNDNSNKITIPIRWVDEGTLDNYKVSFRLYRGEKDETDDIEGIVLSREGDGGTIDVLVQEPIEVPEQVLGPKGLLDPQWGNYRSAIQQMNIGRQLLNTLVIVLWAMFASTMSCAIVGYTFARGRFVGRTKLFLVCIATMMIPAQVTMIPTFILYKTLGWVDTYFPFIVPVFFGNAFFIFLFRQYFLTIPSDLEDAARIDGCGHFGTFWHIMLPMAKPIVITCLVFTFMGTWNSFMGPLIYLNSEHNYTLAIGLAMFRDQYSSMQPNLVMAGSFMMMVPVLTIFFLAQKAFMKGVVVSGVKG
jgi:ABC-type glycerol-3-phosphate transport system permease component